MIRFFDVFGIPNVCGEFQSDFGFKQSANVTSLTLHQHRRVHLEFGEYVVGMGVDAAEDKAHAEAIGWVLATTVPPQKPIILPMG